MRLGYNYMDYEFLTEAGVLYVRLIIVIVDESESFHGWNKQSNNKCLVGFCYWERYSKESESIDKKQKRVEDEMRDQIINVIAKFKLISILADGCPLLDGVRAIDGYSHFF